VEELQNGTKRAEQTAAFGKLILPSLSQLNIKIPL